MNRQIKYKKLQKAAGLNKRQVAELFEVEESTVTRWRSGVTEVPLSVIISLSYRIKYGPHYEVTVDDVDVTEPARLTRAIICDTIAKDTGVKREYIELELYHEGGPQYYWSGKAGAVFDQSGTFTKIKGISLARWVDDFKGRVDRVMSQSNMSQHPDFNTYIESIDWSTDAPSLNNE